MMKDLNNNNTTPASNGTVKGRDNRDKLNRNGGTRKENNTTDIIVKRNKPPGALNTIIIGSETTIGSNDDNQGTKKNDNIDGKKCSIEGTTVTAAFIVSNTANNDTTIGTISDPVFTTTADGIEGKSKLKETRSPNNAKFISGEGVSKMSTLVVENIPLPKLKSNVLQREMTKGCSDSAEIRKEIYKNENSELLVERQTKKHRTLLSSIDAGGPIEDFDIAIQKLKATGFDLDKDINKRQTQTIYHSETRRTNRYSTAMCHFCEKGDLKMVRYLFVNGASCFDCTKDSHEQIYSPMNHAARSHQMHICKWLCEHGGARNDVRMRSTSGYSPLRSAVLSGFSVGKADLLSSAQWLILNGAISSNPDDDSIDTTIIRKDLNPNDRYKQGHCCVDERPHLLLWAQETIQLHSTFLMFLGGTIVTSNQEWSSSSSSSSSPLPLQIFHGKSDIMKLMSDYIGVERRASKLRMLQEFADFLSYFIDETPFVVRNEEEAAEYYNKYPSLFGGPGPWELFPNQGWSCTDSNGEDLSDECCIS